EASKLHTDYLKKHPEQMEKMIGPDGRPNLGLMLTYVPNDEESDFLRAPVKVKYRPSDPNESVTEKDEMNAYNTLVQSAIACIIISILVPAALFYHSYLTKAGPETDLQMYGRSSVKY
ncbi:MAG: hypothetical protein K2Z81_10410, partial [Cyanobacteria bacterium]|nr:hypothetical protein [Cyanobacteriota bacterium]